MKKKVGIPFAKFKIDVNRTQKNVLGSSIPNAPSWVTKPTIHDICQVSCYDTEIVNIFAKPNC